MYLKMHFSISGLYITPCFLDCFQGSTMSNRSHYHCTCSKSLCRKQGITRHKCNPAEPRKDGEEPIIHSRVKREQEENIKTKTTLETKTDSSEHNPNRENDEQKAPKNSKTDSSELNPNRENDKKHLKAQKLIVLSLILIEKMTNKKHLKAQKTDSSELNPNRENDKQKAPKNSKTDSSELNPKRENDEQKEPRNLKRKQTLEVGPLSYEPRKKQRLMSENVHGRLFNKCKECGKNVLKRNMLRHYRMVHGIFTQIEDHLPAVLISPTEGIFMVSKSKQGNQYPLHVVYAINGSDKRLLCESNT